MNTGLSRKWLRMLAVPVTAALALAGCSSSKSSTSSGGGSSSGTFTIPIIESMSGAGAPYGKQDQLAYNLAVDDINAHGGVNGHKLAVKYYDDQSSPTVGVQKLRSLGSDTLVAGGIAFSSVAAGVFPAAKSAQIPFVSGSVSDSDIVQTGQPWTFSTLSPVQITEKPMVEQWLRVAGLGGKSIGVIYDSKNAATQKQGKIMTDALKGAGVSISNSVQTQTGAPSYASQAATIASSHPAGVAICALAQDAAAIVHQVRSAGVTGPLWLCPATTTNTLASLLGSDVSDTYLAWNWWNTLTGAQNAKFTSDFKARSGGTEPAASGPTCYEAITLIAQALKETHALTSTDSVSTKREAIRKYIASASNFQGITGTLTMQSNGSFNAPGVLLKVTKGVINPVAGS